MITIEPRSPNFRPTPKLDHERLFNEGLVQLRQGRGKIKGTIRVRQHDFRMWNDLREYKWNAERSIIPSSHA